MANRTRWLAIASTALRVATLRLRSGQPPAARDAPKFRAAAAALRAAAAALDDAALAAETPTDDAPLMGLAHRWCWLALVSAESLAALPDPTPAQRARAIQHVLAARRGWALATPEGLAWLRGQMATGIVRPHRWPDWLRSATAPAPADDAGGAG